MSQDGCRYCGRALPRRDDRRGRAAVYCSAACRQRAYRSRRTAGAGEVVPRLISDVRQRAQALTPAEPGAFYADVTGLADTVGKLRRVARLARDAAQSTPTPQPGDDHTVEPGNGDPGNGEPDGETSAGPSADTLDGVETLDGAETGETGGSAAAGSGGMAEGEFAGLIEGHRRELHVHCYRMVGSYDDAEELVQETLLRAWKGRAGFAGRASFRGWLYRIATNVCLDFLRRHPRTVEPYPPMPGVDTPPAAAPPRVTWLQPYPDELLDGVAAEAAGPEDTAVARETMELTYLVALQQLPPRQRAALLLRDVLGRPAADVAEVLATSAASVNSALQRARATLRAHLPERRGQEWTSARKPTAEEFTVVRRLMDATSRGDDTAMAELLAEDVRVTMPPNPMWFAGRDTYLSFLRTSLDPSSPQYFGAWAQRLTSANRQPAVAEYVQRPGTRTYRAQVLDVLRITNGKVTEITAFEPHLFGAFGLPLTL